MNESKKEMRKDYRAHMRSEWWGILIFAAMLYVITLSGAALLMFVDSVTGALFFNIHHSTDEAPLVTAYFWANLILTIFLIAIAVLYISGGPAGIPFIPSKKDGKDKT
jgi:hypothetical protein